MTEVMFKVDFQEYEKGQKVELKQKHVKRYVDHFCVAEVVKPRAKKKQAAASSNKMVGAAANK